MAYDRTNGTVPRGVVVCYRRLFNSTPRRPTDSRIAEGPGHHGQQ